MFRARIGGLLLCSCLALIAPSATANPAAETDAPSASEPAFSWEGPERPQIGVVFTGGGAKGTAYIGVLRVLEEVGIPIDYISGTSMGAIIAGLYAAGYDPDELEEMILSREWDALLLDQVPRKFAPLPEKLDDGKYPFGFPLINGRASLPRGLIAGQNITSFLSKATLHVHQIEDFSDLPTPFFCTAMDITNGDGVVLDRGSLALAIRASMSMPSLHEPVEIDGRLLVDGGMAFSFPVSDTRARGMDFIIGSKTVRPLAEKEEIRTFLDVINNAIGLRGADDIRLQEKDTDILIVPDIEGVDTGSFANSAQMIQRGEDAAREFEPQLRELKAILERYPPAPPRTRPPLVQELDIREVEFHGLETVSEQVALSQLDLDTDGPVTPPRLKNAITRMYASRSYEYVRFERDPLPGGGDRLRIHVRENTTGRLQLGALFNTETGAGLRVRVQLPHVGLRNSQLLLRGVLAKRPTLSAEYLYDIGGPLRLGASARVRYREFTLALGDGEGNTRVAEFLVRQAAGNIDLYSLPYNSVQLGIGFEYRYSRLNTRVGIDAYDRSNYYTPYAFLTVDNRDRAVYPRRGLLLRSRASHVEQRSEEFTIAGEELDRQLDPFQHYYVLLDHALTFGERWTILTDLDFGGSSGTDVPFNFGFFQGGFLPYGGINFPLYGYDHFAYGGQFAYSARLGFRMELPRTYYLTLSGNIGNTSDESRDLFQGSAIRSGYGVGLGTPTIVGPVDLLTTWSPDTGDVFVHFSIGIPE